MAKKRLSLSNYIEGVGAVILYFLFRAMPVDVASAIGGFLARMFGPMLGITKRGRENLRRALPELSAEQHERILRDMWDNLGRVVAEYPHLNKFRLFEKNGRIEGLDGGNILTTHDPSKRYIFFSGHCGNWEIGMRTASQVGFQVVGVYRAPNNPIVDRLMIWARGSESGELVPKGDIAARRAFGAVREGKSLCMLVDQKMNDGIPVPFFGRDAMTAPALAVLALRYDCEVVPIRMVRLKGAYFRMESEPPLALPKTGNNEADRLALMTECNRVLERWVRQYPAQWLWVHRRWPD